MLTQRNVVSNAEHAQMTFAFREDDVWLHVAPLFHSPTPGPATS